MREREGETEEEEADEEEAGGTDIQVMCCIEHFAVVLQITLGCAVITVIHFAVLL